MCDIAEMRGTISELRQIIAKSEDKAIFGKAQEPSTIHAETNKKIAKPEALLENDN